MIAVVDLHAKPFYLNDEQIAWVEETIKNMSFDDRSASCSSQQPASETAEETIERLEKIGMKPNGFLLRGAVSKDIRGRSRVSRTIMRSPSLSPATSTAAPAI